VGITYHGKESKHHRVKKPNANAYQVEIEIEIDVEIPGFENKLHFFHFIPPHFIKSIYSPERVFM